MPIIAIEQSLHQVEEILRNNGYEVVGIYTNAASDADAMVISGMDQNVMGIAEAATSSPVISAEGKTPEEILNQVQQSVPQQ